MIKAIHISGIDLKGLWSATGEAEVDNANHPSVPFSVPLTEDERRDLQSLLDKVSERTIAMVGDVNK